MNSITSQTHSDRHSMTFDIEADWTLNLLCNYDCEYCFSRAFTEHPLVGRISPEQYLDFFDSTGKVWLLHLTGGEPFLHRDFVRLCRTLASRVQCVHCGVHAGERDRRKGWAKLLANVTFLLERGFPVFASLVMTPSAFADFPRVADSFAKLGVPLIPKALRGSFEGRWYPQAYTEARGSLIVQRSIRFSTGIIFTDSPISRTFNAPQAGCLSPSAMTGESSAAARKPFSAISFSVGSICFPKIGPAITRPARTGVCGIPISRKGPRGITLAGAREVRLSRSSLPSAACAGRLRTGWRVFLKDRPASPAN